MAKYTYWAHAFPPASWPRNYWPGLYGADYPDDLTLAVGAAIGPTGHIAAQSVITELAAVTTLAQGSAQALATPMLTLLVELATSGKLATIQLCELLTSLTLDALRQRGSHREMTLGVMPDVGAQGTAAAVADLRFAQACADGVQGRAGAAANLFIVLAVACIARPLYPTRRWHLHLVQSRAYGLVIIQQWSHEAAITQAQAWIVESIG